MAISKELEMKGTRKPILLKGTGQTMCLEVKIGSLGLEVWHFPNEEAHPYARLILEPDQDGKAHDQAEQGRSELSVTVDWQQACAVSEAVLGWLSYIESNIEDHRIPALHVELASLTFDFYRHGGGQGPRMICTAETEHGLSRQVILTRSEASLLGRLLFYLGDEETDQQD
jgi:hypothetical protein